MKIHGTISENLSAALRSTARLRGQRVHPETLGFWQDLLSYARESKADFDGNPALLEQQIAALDAELRSRGEAA